MLDEIEFSPVPFALALLATGSTVYWMFFGYDAWTNINLVTRLMIAVGMFPITYYVGLRLIE